MSDKLEDVIRDGADTRYLSGDQVARIADAIRQRWPCMREEHRGWTWVYDHHECIDCGSTKGGTMSARIGGGE